MKNPFESKHIKNYILLYVSVVVIVILFFIATKIFRQNKEIDKKVFIKETTQSIDASREIEKNEEEPSLTSKIKLMDKSY
nr:hypothetical protein [uncultured Sulfurimonas sp.]